MVAGNRVLLQKTVARLIKTAWRLVRQMQYEGGSVATPQLRGRLLSQPFSVIIFRLVHCAFFIAAL